MPYQLGHQTWRGFMVPVYGIDSHAAPAQTQLASTSASLSCVLLKVPYARNDHCGDLPWWCVGVSHGLPSPDCIDSKCAVSRCTAFKTFLPRSELLLDPLVLLDPVQWRLIWWVSRTLTNSAELLSGYMIVYNAATVFAKCTSRVWDDRCLNI